MVAFSDYDMMNSFSFPDKIPLTNDLSCVFDRSAKRNKNYYYKSGDRYYDLLNNRIPDTTGMYRIDDSGVAKKIY